MLFIEFSDIPVKQYSSCLVYNVCIHLLADVIAIFKYEPSRRDWKINELLCYLVIPSSFYLSLNKICNIAHICIKCMTVFFFIVL